jgi:predicted phage terminase large subunit-like protein
MNQVSSELLSNEWKVALSGLELDNVSHSILEYEGNKLLAEVSLHEFLKQAWSWIEGDVPFVDGWHIRAICEHLEAVSNRQIKNLLINLPPRCSKSTLVSIAVPAWCWIRNPGERFLYASYSFSLTSRDSQKCRALIQSPWYQKNWGNRFQLLRDQNTKKRFDNTATGYRIATSSGSGTTGEGGSMLIADDPNNASDGISDVYRENRVDWWTGVWSTRLNDRKNDCRVVVQQRIHERDITGFILSHDDINEWTKLILPMEYEAGRKSSTVVLPSTNGKVWEDPRMEEGALLWPEKIDAAGLESLKNSLGSQYRIAGQLQQRPSPSEGGIIKKDWFCWWKDSTPQQIEFILQSWDTALTANEMSAYSACTTWGVFYDSNNIENVILLSMWRGRVEYPELRELAKRMYFDYRDNGKVRNPAFKGRPVNLCLIEAKASGDPLIQDLNRAGIRAIPFIPKGDKIARVRYITPLIEGGRVWLPARVPKYDTLLPFADEFYEAAASFPNAESRDLVDTMTQALTKLRDGQFLQNPRDERPVQASTKEILELY